MYHNKTLIQIDGFYLNKCSVVVHNKIIIITLDNSQEETGMLAKLAVRWT